jgi:rubrerythrin
MTDLNWRLEDIDFQVVDLALVHDDEMLFYMLASASFVEILSELYSSNLINHFSSNVEVVTWLKKHWQREEVQHGRALKAYVQAVWPEFDWDRAYEGFCAEYSALCTAQKLEPSCALEMVARCVVETGTTTFYRALHDYVKEPVLLKLVANIKADEAKHYTHFRHYFEAYNHGERHNAWAVVGAILRRVREIRAEDTYIAFKHVYRGRHPEKLFHSKEWRRYSKMIRRHARHHYPYSIAFRMLSKPVPLAEPFKRILQWSLVGLARLVTLG